MEKGEKSMPNYVTNIVTFSGNQDTINKIFESIRIDNEPIGTIDFQKIVPMPETLNISSGSYEHDALGVYLSAINPDTEDMGIKKLSKKDFDALVKFLKSSGQLSDRVDIKLTYKDVVERNRSHLERNIKTDPRFAGKHLFGDDLLGYGNAIVDNLKKYGHADWYSWRCENWGTKWNACNVCAKSPNSNSISFDTAWSAPHPIIEKLTQLFPDVEIEHKWADEDWGSNCGYCYAYDGSASSYYKDDDEDALEFSAEILGIDTDSFYRSKNGNIYMLDCDMKSEITKTEYDEIVNKGFSFGEFASKIAYDEETETYDLNHLSFSETQTLLTLAEAADINIDIFFYTE
jgi:hypothetical protein